MATKAELQERVDKLEAVLQESESRYQSFVENHPYGVHENSPDGTITYVNKAYCDIFEFDSPEDVVGKKVWDFMPTEEAKEWLRQHIAHLVNDQPDPTTDVNPGATSKGRPIVVRIDWDYLRDEEGELTGFINVTADITEQKAIEKAQAEQNALLNSILTSLPVGVWVADQEFNVLLTNKTQQDMMGREIVSEGGEAHVERYAVIDINTGKMYDESKLPIVQTMMDGQPHIAGDMGIRWPDGKVVPVMTTTSALLDAEGNQVGAIAITQDISERHEAEIEQKRLQQEVIDAQRRALQELSTPVIPVMDRILVMPLIGSIDTLRAKDITRALLRGISEQQAKVIILDVTGVPIIDSGVANHLNKTVQAARLKGAHTIVTGISDAVAETIVDLGIDWSNIETLSDLQTGLMAALSRMGLRLARKRSK